MNKKYYVKKISMVGLIMIALLCSGCAEWKKKWEAERGVVHDDKISIKEKQIHHVSEEISLVRPTMEDEGDISMKYTVEKVVVVPDFFEAGIREEQIKYPIEYLKNGEVTKITCEDMKTNPMLIVDINITNINEEDPNISVFNLIEKKEDEVVSSTYPCYYSLGKNTEEGEYYHFPLAKGETVDVRVGYYINKADESWDGLMLTDNYGGDDEITNYVDLGL